MKKSNLIKGVALLSAGFSLLGIGLTSHKVNADVIPAGEIDGQPYNHVYDDDGFPSKTKAITSATFFKIAPDWFSGPRASHEQSHNFKIHWFKKPRRGLLSQNVDFFASQSLTGRGYDNLVGVKVATPTYYVGKVTINGQTTCLLDGTGFITSDEDRKMPSTLLYNATGHSIPLYMVNKRYILPKEHNIPLDDVDVRLKDTILGYYPSKATKLRSNTKHLSTIVVPTHHQAYDILGTRYVPVLAHDAGDSKEEGIYQYLMKESDFKTLTKRKHMVIRDYHYDILSQNGNKLKTSVDKSFRKDDRDVMRQKYRDAIDTLKHKKSMHSYLKNDMENRIASLNRCNDTEQ